MKTSKRRRPSRNSTPLALRSAVARIAPRARPHHYDEVRGLNMVRVKGESIPLVKTPGTLASFKTKMGRPGGED